jgi:hypothetical protein
MTRGDQAIEKSSAKLRDLSSRAAAHGGLAQKAAKPLAEDAAFLRKLKPSLIAARAKGEAPAGQEPGSAEVPAAPAGPQVKRSKPKSGGPNPFLVVGAAVAVGVLLAKVLDWRGHAHPRD